MGGKKQSKPERQKEKKAERLIERGFRKKAKKLLKKGLTKKGKLDTLVNARLKRSKTKQSEAALEPRKENSLKAKK
jgi:hypothetical protein